MAKCTITIEGGGLFVIGRQVAVTVSAGTDVEALSRAITAVLAVYSSDIRRAVDELRITLGAVAMRTGGAQPSTPPPDSDAPPPDSE